MSIELIILLYIVALVILVIEVFVPSGGVLAVVGILALLLSIYYGFQQSAVLGVGQIVVSLTVVPLIFFYGIKKLTLKKSLPTEEGFRSEKAELSSLLNKEGVVVTSLRPSGTVQIEGKKYDVVTEGEMIDRNTPVHVVNIEGSRIVVKTIQAK